MESIERPQNQTIQGCSQLQRGDGRMTLHFHHECWGCSRICKERINNATENHHIPKCDSKIKLPYGRDIQQKQLPSMDQKELEFEYVPSDAEHCFPENF